MERTQESFWMRTVLRCCTLLTVTACSLSSLVDHANLPANLSDPNAVKTEAGALGAYRHAYVSFASAVAGDYAEIAPNNNSQLQSYIIVSGILTDELRAVSVKTVDLRNLLEADNYGAGPYRNLQRVRGQTSEAIGALRKYAPHASVVLQGHMYAIEGMAEILLAELYCSGIPLSTVDFEADYTITRGFSNDEVYTHALARLDSASKYAGDSAQIVSLIAVGRGRALLALGQYKEAAQVVANVPDNYQYLLTFDITRKKAISVVKTVPIGNVEGLNGLPFGSHTDPRTELAALSNVTAPLVFASGVEARLIQAEAALAEGRTEEWLSILNALRTTCTTAANCPIPAPPGTAGVGGLSRLDDPALELLPPDKDTTDVRVDLMFRERAYWLFLTGHRQGDLRRLVRQYHRPEFTVYPTGLWEMEAGAAYGSDVTVPVPQEEAKQNPLYDGCFNRDA